MISDINLRISVLIYTTAADVDNESLLMSDILFLCLDDMIMMWWSPWEDEEISPAQLTAWSLLTDLDTYSGTVQYSLVHWAVQYGPPLTTIIYPARLTTVFSMLKDLPNYILHFLKLHYARSGLKIDNILNLLEPGCVNKPFNEEC